MPISLAQYQAMIEAGARRNDDPEARLQRQVVAEIEPRLPPGVIFTASAAGVRVTQGVRAKMKAQGVRRGWPDLQFLFPDGVTRYIELKAGSSLSADQKAFRDRTEPHGIWAIAKSVDDVIDTLTKWLEPYGLSLERNRNAR